MKRFTQNEKSGGEFAVRSMSKTAQKSYYGTDCISVYEYIDYEKTTDEEKVIRYAINHYGDITLDLTFEQAEKYLESLVESEDDE